MATTPADVISLAALKAQLGEDGTEHDDLFERLTRDAVRKVQRETGLPVLTRQETYRIAPRRSREDPLLIRRNYIVSVVSVKGWRPATAQRLAADLVIGDLGRSEYRDGHQDPPELYEIWPPETGWPEVNREPRLLVTVSRGMDDDEVVETVPAVVQLVREAWDLDEDPKGSQRLLSRLVRPRIGGGDLDAGAELDDSRREW